MDEKKTYKGSCHCGAVRYEVDMAPPSKAVACNCSMCSRAGWLLTFVPGADFRLQASSEDALTEYRFAKQHIEHVFCRTCGVRSFSRGKGKDGQPMISINLRCVEGIDAPSLPVQHFDGASL